MRDIYNRLAKVHLQDAKDLAYTDTKTKIADLQGFEGALVIVNLGAFTGADGSNYLTPILQESDTTADVDFTAVAAGDILGAFTVVNDTTTKDSTTQMVGYIGNKRYIRVLLDYTGTAISASLVSVDAILGLARHLPPTAPDPVTAT